MITEKIITTCLGIGYIRKGGGTYASIACLLIWYFAQAGGSSVLGQCIITLVLLVLGIYAGNVVEKEWGKDSYRVVIDEAVGMCITLLFIPLEWKYLLTGLILFRIMDIFKPLYIRRMEKFPGGWGVMLDDVLAAIYAHLLLQLIILMHIY
jgi:phosphatidylglycerophosphatase A